MGLIDRPTYPTWNHPRQQIREEHAVLSSLKTGLATDGWTDCPRNPAISCIPLRHTF